MRLVPNGSESIRKAVADRGDFDPDSARNAEDKLGMGSQIFPHGSRIFGKWRRIAYI